MHAGTKQRERFFTRPAITDCEREVSGVRSRAIHSKSTCTGLLNYRWTYLSVYSAYRYTLVCRDRSIRYRFVTVLEINKIEPCHAPSAIFFRGDKSRSPGRWSLHCRVKNRIRRIAESSREEPPKNESDLRLFCKFD